MIDCQDLVCPACGGPLRAVDTALGCSRCNAAHTTLQGVALLLPGLAVQPGSRPDAGFVEDMTQAVWPWQEGGREIASAAMADLFSTRFSFPDRQLGNEGSRFLQRLRSSGYAIREQGGEAGKTIQWGPEAALPPIPPDALTLTLLTAPPAVTVGSEFWIQVRITNTGRGVLRSSGPDATRLSYATRDGFPWITSRRSWRRAARVTDLLIDLPPGQAMTQPIRMTASRRLGPQHYRAVAVMPGSARRDTQALPVAIEGVPASQPDPLTVDWPYSAIERGYAEDHDHAVGLLATWLRERFVGNAAPRVLELGGNSAPMLAKPALALPGARLYNVDVDPFGLVFGTVQRRLARGHVIQDVVADGMRLPFADGSLDAVVMFATLHHFPDPIALLRHLRSKLAPGGLICALCEPVGHVSHDDLPPDVRDELVNGICEQAFEPWEWRYLFEAAGLRVVAVRHDCGSLKIALEMAGGH